MARQSCTSLSAVAILACAASAQQGAYVRIPAGSLSPLYAKDQTVVFDRPFRINRTEVTLGQYRRFVNATGYVSYGERPDRAPGWQRRTWREPGFPTTANQPVVWVTAADAEAFCRWDGGRLPSEAEWEYASRAGASTRHHFGDVLDPTFVWYRENSKGRLPRVATRSPNLWGLHDTEGGVWELVRGASGTPVLRGGSWMNCPAISPWAPQNPVYRRPLGSAPHHRDDDIGFRCVRDLPQP